MPFRSAFVAVAALPVALAGALSLPASAKLPALSDDAKAKMSETVAKTAWTDKVGLYKLCLAMDRTAGAYRANMSAAGKTAPAAEALASCADPGPYVTQVTPVADKPLEASGAHSPPGMATGAPSSKATSAEMTGPRK